MERRTAYQKPTKADLKNFGDFVRVEDTPLPEQRVTLARGKEAVEETTTDKDGGYRFGELDPGLYMVKVRQPEGAIRKSNDPEDETRQVRVESEPVEGIDFRFRMDGISVGGRVTDTRGSPIEGARVRIASIIPKNEPYAEVSRSGEYWAVHALTGKDGRYRIDGLEPASFYLATGYLAQGLLRPRWEGLAEAEGYAPTLIVIPPFTERAVEEAYRFMEDFVGLMSVDKKWEKWDWDPSFPKVALPESEGDAITGIDFVLHREARVSGRVVGTRGEAVKGQGASVQMRPTDSAAVDKAPPLVCVSKGATGSVHLDDAGSFTISRVHPGVYKFFVHAASGASGVQKARNEPLVVGEGDVLENVEVVVESAADRGDIAGLVRDVRTGAPVEGFTVQILEVKSPDEPDPRSGILVTEGLEAGAFLVKGVSPGTTRLRIAAPGYVDEEVQVDVVSSETTQLISDLLTGSRLVGRVTLNGEAREGVYLTASLDDRRGGELPAKFAKDGRYELGKLAAGRHLVRAAVILPGAKGSTTQINEAKWIRIGEAEEVRLDLEIHGSATIRGSFSGPDDRLSWRLLVLDDPPRGEGSETDRAKAMVWNIAKGGEYRIDHLPPGAYTVMGRICKRGTWTTVDGMERSVPVALKAGQTATVDFAFP